jgi:hypothetical protein
MGPRQQTLALESTLILEIPTFPFILAARMLVNNVVVHFIRKPNNKRGMYLGNSWLHDARAYS